VPNDLKPVGYPPKEFAQIRRESLATVYNRLNAGVYKAVKNGKLTLIIHPDPYDVSDLPEYKPGEKPTNFNA
jgi:hypothetical protein